MNDPASLGILTSLFGRPTAQRIVAARPYPSVANTVRVEGVGRGRLNQLAGVLCATPVPVEHAGTGWAWIYERAGGENRYADFAMTMGAHILDRAPGAWTSIAPLEPDPAKPGGPRANFHVHADWTGNDDVVWVELPDDPYAAPDSWQPLIRHDHGNDFVTFIAKDGLREIGAGRMQAPVTSLSSFQAVQQPATAFLYLDRETVSGDFVQRRLAADQAELNAISYNESCNPDVSDQRPYIQVSADPGRLVAGIGSGQRAPASYCVEGDLRAESVTAKLANETGLVYSLQAGYSVSDRISFAGAPDVSGVDTLSKFYYTILDNSDAESVRLFAPGMQYDLKVPVDPNGNEVLVNYDPTGTAGAFSVRMIGNIAEPLGVVADLIECWRLKFGAYDNVVGALRACAKADTASDATVNEKVKGLDRWLTIFEVGTDLSEAIQAIGSTAVSGTVRIAYTRQLAPTSTPTGGLIHPSCTYVGSDGRTGYDLDCQRRFEGSLVDPGGPPDSSGCWSYDILAGAWVLNASSGQGCLNIPSGPSTGGPGANGSYYNSGPVFCGVGPCVKLPEAAGKIVELTNGRSYYLEADGSAWHLATTDAFFSCGGESARIFNPSWNSFKWSEFALSRFTIRGDRYFC